MMTITLYTRQASIYIAIMLLVVVGACLAGCSKDIVVPEQDGESVMLSISGRALNPSTDEQINTVRLILITRGPSHIVIINKFISNPTDPVIIEAKSGDYDVYMIANEQSDGKEYDPLKSIATRMDLEKITLPAKPTLLTMTAIPMLGEVLNVTITAPAGVSSTSNLANVKIGGVDKGTTLPVELTRLLCKLNLTIHYTQGTIKEVKLDSLPDKLPFWENNYFTPSPRSSIEVIGLTANNGDNTDPMYPLTSYKEKILLPSWVFADPTNINDAVQLAVTMITKPKVEPDPIVEETYKCAIGHAIGALDNPKDYTLKRNHDYSLTALIKNNTITVTSLIESWNEEDLNIDDDNPVVPAP